MLGGPGRLIASALGQILVAVDSCALFLHVDKNCRRTPHHMNKVSGWLVAFGLVFSWGASASLPRGAYLPYYQYTVSDVAQMGLTSQRLFQELMRTSMDLKNSVCSNRAHFWGYDLYRKYKIQPGRIFVFFISDIWANDKQGWMYHAGTYVMENGEVKVLEGSYPDEVFKPLTITEWIDTEMEGREDPKKCIEITEADTDLTEYFFARNNLPAVRSNGKPGAPCYYRMVPGYLPYPASVAEVELKRDARGNPSDYSPKGFDLDEVFAACEDSFSGGKFMKRAAARQFCKSYLRF